MANDPNLDTLDPDVTLDNNSIPDSSDLDIDSQLGNADLPTDDEPNPSDDFPVEDQPDDSVPPNGDGSQVPPQAPPQVPPQVPPAANAPNVQALIDAYLDRRARQQQQPPQPSSSDFAARRDALLRMAEEQARRLRQQPPSSQPPQPPVPPSEQDPVRYQYYLQLCRFMDPRQALDLVNQQDQYYEARFQKQFDSAMKQFQPFFQRQAEEAYVTDLGRLTDAHIDNFHAAASAFGVTPEESAAVVKAYIGAYIQSGHRDLADIHNWFASNSPRILAATIQEKKKILEEQERSNAKSQYEAGKNAPTTVVPSTKAAQTLVSTGQEALMKKDGAITGGAPSGTAPSAANGVIQSLMAQTGLNAFSAS